MKIHHKCLSSILATVTLHGLACGAELHVNVAAEPKGDGSGNQPFQTIQEAIDHSQPGDTVLIHSGTYRETVALDKSGTKTAPIRIMAAPGAEVTVSGLDPVRSEWETWKRQIRQANVKIGKETQLFYRGKWMQQARWPNARFPDDMWTREVWASTGAGSAYGKVVDQKLADAEIDFTGAIAILNVAHQFWTWPRPVISHEVGSDTFHYPKTLHQGVTAEVPHWRWDDDYYIMVGLLDLLDSPEEWFFDKDRETLYFWPSKEGVFDKTQVEIKVRDFGIQGEGLQYVEIAGIRFLGSTLDLLDSDNILIEDCHFRYATFVPLHDEEPIPSNGVSTRISGDNNIIRRCSVAFSANTGIHVLGSNNLVEDCLVHDVGWYGSLSHVGIRLGPESGADAFPTGDEVGRSILRQSTVFNTGNTMVSIGDMPNNVVELNHFYNGGRLCNDVSLVYTQHPLSAGTQFIRNWVHDCYAEEIALGIRGDDQSRGLTVAYNVLWNIGWDAILLKGDGHAVYHNTCFNNGFGYAETHEVAGKDLLLRGRPEVLKIIRREYQYPLLPLQNRFTSTFNNAVERVGTERSLSSEVSPLAGPAANNHIEEGVTSLLEDPENFDFRPRSDSPLIDQGMVIPGVNQNYLGKAPDIGAYERGGEYWIPGVTWSEYSVESDEPILK